MSFLKDQIHGFISKGGLKAGLQPVEGLEKEEERVEELLRLDVIDKDLTNEREFNNVTQLACFLTATRVFVVFDSQRRLSVIPSAKAGGGE